MKSRLTWFVVAAMITGPLCGWLLHETLGTGAAADSAAAGFSLVTTSFLRLIKMIIAPLVLSTLIVGVARMEGAASIARIGAKSLGWFIVATMISMTIGVVRRARLERGRTHAVQGHAGAHHSQLHRSGHGEQRSTANCGVFRPVWRSRVRLGREGQAAHRCH